MKGQKKKAVTNDAPFHRPPSLGRLRPENVE